MSPAGDAPQKQRNWLTQNPEVLALAVIVLAGLTCYQAPRGYSLELASYPGELAGSVVEAGMSVPEAILLAEADGIPARIERKLLKQERCIMRERHRAIVEKNRVAHRRMLQDMRESRLALHESFRRGLRQIREIIHPRAARLIRDKF